MASQPRRPRVLKTTVGRCWSSSPKRARRACSGRATAPGSPGTFAMVRTSTNCQSLRACSSVGVIEQAVPARSAAAMDPAVLSTSREALNAPAKPRSSDANCSTVSAPVKAAAATSMRLSIPTAPQASTPSNRPVVRLENISTNSGIDPGNHRSCDCPGTKVRSTSAAPKAAAASW